MEYWVKCAVGLATGGLLVGCGIRSQVRQAAAPALKCDEQSIKVTKVDRDQTLRRLGGAPNQAFAEGCGDQVLMVEFCPRGVRSGNKACTWVPARKLKYDAIVRRASFDLSCEPGLVSVQYLDARTVGVNACTSQVTYIWSCPHDPDLYSAKCTWVMNNETLRRAAPPPAAPVNTAPAQQPAELPPPASTVPPPGEVPM